MAGDTKNFDKKVILFKVETTEGTDSTPTSAADALKVLNYRPTFMDAEQRTRPVEKAFFGADAVALTAIKRGATFDMEMHGSGTATGVPPWMKVARIAGFDAGTVGASSVIQKPITDAIPSASHYAYIDDLLMKVIGARANMGFTVTDDDVPLFTFTLLGRAPETLAEQAVPTNPTITGYVDPLTASSENTTFSLDGFAAALRTFTLSNNADMALRSLIGPADYIKMRNRPWSGSALIRVPDLTAKNYFEKIRPGTTMPASLTHGTVAGNIVNIAMPRLQISGNVELSEESGELMATLPLTALPTNAGNDEVVFTTT